MRVTHFEIERSGILAARIVTVALHHDADALHAYILTAVAMELARHRHRYERLRRGHDPAFV
jgi:hypothetical protein